MTKEQFIERIERNYKEVTDEVETMTGKEVFENVYKYHTVEEAKAYFNITIDDFNNLTKNELEAINRLMESETNVFIAIYDVDLGYDYSMLDTYENFMQMIYDEF